MHNSLRRFGKALALVALVVGTASRVEAQAVAWTGPGDFDDAAISFAPILVNQLQSITGPGYAHNHGSPGVVYTIDVHYLASGVWQTIFSSMLPTTGDHALSSLVPPPASFATGLIDGVRLTATPDVGQGYHGMYGSQFGTGPTVFNFGVGASTVPEPGTLGLVAGGVIGLVGIARRRRQAVTA